MKTIGREHFAIYSTVLLTVAGHRDKIVERSQICLGLWLRMISQMLLAGGASATWGHLPCVP